MLTAFLFAKRRGRNFRELYSNAATLALGVRFIEFSGSAASGFEAAAGEEISAVFC